MKQMKFNKTICGVDFLLNVIDFQSVHVSNISSETITADFFQVFFIKNAKGYLKLNDEHLELKPNSIVFISQHQNHSWHVDYSTFEGQILIFQDAFLNTFFSDQYFTFRLLYFYQTTYPLQIMVDPTFFNNNMLKLSEIKKELNTPKMDSVHLIRSILYYVLIALNRKYTELNHIELAIGLDNAAYKFRQLVEENIHTHQRVEDYTVLMKMSRITLNKVVKNQFNITATEFIKSRLLFEIKMKLIHTDHTVLEIADEFCFSEPNHLSRFFKSKEGLTPMAYRENYQNGRDL